MTYLPSELINENYIYSIDNTTNNILILKNCENIVCTCNVVLTNLDYQITDDFVCSTNDISYTLNSGFFTDNFYYRIDLPLILLTFLILFLFIIYLPYRVICHFYKGFKL